MADKPSSADIQKAKDYIKQRLEAQSIVSDKLEGSFSKAAEDIALIVAKYKARGTRLRFTGTSSMAKEIDEVIERLKREMEGFMFEYGIPDYATDEEAEEIYRTMMGEYHDATFAEREALYAKNYLKELSDAGFEDMEIDNEEFEQAIRESEDKTEKRLLILAAATVAVGWMTYWTMSHAEKKLSDGSIVKPTGFFVMPGSSNPCPYCESMFGRLHPMSDPIPIYHPNCCCILIYHYE